MQCDGEQETIACMRARRDELSSNQSVAVVNNLAEIGGSYVPLLAAWCAQLLPEIADEDEVGAVLFCRIYPRDPFSMTVLISVSYLKLDRLYFRAKQRRENVTYVLSQRCCAGTPFLDLVEFIFKA